MPEPQTPESQTKKWTVRLGTGEIYHGVVAPTREAAIAKMRQGPQGPLAPKGESAAPAEELKQATQEFMRVTGAPRTGREAAAMAVPAAVGALIPSGRTIPRIAGQVLGNVLGRGAVEGVGEALKPTGEGALGAALRGGMKGILPGIAQAGLGAAFGPKADTIRAERMVKAIKSEAISPEVKAVLSEFRPGELLQRRTWKKMEKAAGDLLDSMEATVSKKLGPKFQFSMTDGAQVTRVPFETMRARIKELRASVRNWARDPATAKAAQEAKVAATRIERDMVAQMQQGGHAEAAKTYADAIAQHERNSNAVRFVQGQQEANKIAGGVNPQDFPGLAAAQKASQKGGGLRHAIHGIVGATEVATGHPGFGAYQLSKALAGSSPLRPQNVRPSALRSRLPGVLGGLGANVGQQAIGQTAPFQRSTGE